MPTGIVLSTQSPEKNNTEFPRRGGTGAGINKVTNYPVMKMHRDAKPRDDEIDAYKAIENGSIVFITGHSNTGLDNITGDYVPPLFSSQPVEPISTEWTYQQFRDLLVDNGNLKPGDHITVVLWACNAGEGDLGSGAALMGRLFREAGIDTTIISSANPTLRFNGKYKKTADGDVMEFKTENGAKDLRIFEFTKEKTVMWRNKNPIIVTANGIEGYKLYNRQELEVLESDQITSVVKEICSDKRYKDNVSKDNLEKYLDRDGSNFLLRWSSANASVNDGFLYFTASSIIEDSIHNVRYGINLKGEIYGLKDGKMERIKLLPTGVVDSIERHFDDHYRKEQGLKHEQDGEKEPEQEHRAERKARHRHRGEKESEHKHHAEKKARHGHRGEKESDHEHHAEKKARHGHRGEKPKHSDNREKESEFVRPLFSPTKGSDFVGPQFSPAKESMFVRALNPPTSRTKQNSLFSHQDGIPVAQKKAGNPNITGGKRRDQHEPLDKLKGQMIPTRTHRKQAAQDIGPNPGKKGGIFEQPAKEKEPSSKTQPPGPRTPRRN